MGVPWIEPTHIFLEVLNKNTIKRISRKINQSAHFNVTSYSYFKHQLARFAWCTYFWLFLKISPPTLCVGGENSGCKSHFWWEIKCTFLKFGHFLGIKSEICHFCFSLIWSYCYVFVCFVYILQWPNSRLIDSISTKNNIFPFQFICR